ncbi:hypothetical protein NE237_017492 [Protea cynaroides]|uniref:Uncharacterized protein n=1 Tax=Protea cynaroides TaxID=273540 RepID=A0A9Q0K857_9MAGN|nr:hypothetical protein NE237_017492 [Protea cynaroides]
MVFSIGSSGSVAEGDLVMQSSQEPKRCTVEVSQKEVTVLGVLVPTNYCGEQVAGSVVAVGLRLGASCIYQVETCDRSDVNLMISCVTLGLVPVGVLGRFDDANMHWDCIRPLSHVQGSGPGVMGEQMQVMLPIREVRLVPARVDVRGGAGKYPISHVGDALRRGFCEMGRLGVVAVEA